MMFISLVGICLDILQNRWSPTYDVSAILTSIQSLLDEPNPNSPANSVAAQLVRAFHELLLIFIQCNRSSLLHDIDYYSNFSTKKTAVNTKNESQP